MKILVITLQVSDGNSKGHIHPFITTTQKLISMGHDVFWLSLPKALSQADREQVESLGAQVVVPPPLKEGIIKENKELARLAMDKENNYQAYKSFLLDPVPHQLDGLMELIKDLAPNVVLQDNVLYSAAIACTKLQLPFVSICVGPKIMGKDFEESYLGNLQPIIEPRRAMFESYGVKPNFRLFEYVSPYANIIFATEEFVDKAALPENSFLVGSAVPQGGRGDDVDFPWEDVATDKNIIYAAFGCVLSKMPLADVIDPIFKAADALDAQLILASEHLAASAKDFGRHIVVSYAPQLEILKKAHVFITHGGASSVMESIYFGVPPIVVPLSSDQPVQAQLVEKAGVGFNIAREQWNDEVCLATLQKLLASGNEFAAKCKTLQTTYQNNDGAKNAADIILRFAVTNS
ncbi:glycosyltransferase [Candidatus Uabimicrobium amorphum]|uniref:Putative UDP-glucosyltransferase YojK n=1 Tax=Uabimicrobium amorphum TaxID=2596890 RepID=A0A5S9IQ16_UABAM|nr:glycosyltransferase [Candidatus Uabimicrobium amorphum]BBM85978.1 putative UDP-glucosyltransferase YojK [Candidatus Uabimicrobium amorphum]